MRVTAVGIALSVGWIGARQAEAKCRPDPADAVSETRQVRGFQRIRVSGPIDLIVVQGSRESLTLRTDRKLLPRVRSAVSDGRLTLDIERDVAARNECLNDTTFEVTVVNLSDLDVWGPSRVEIGKLGGKRLAIDLRGPTEMVAGAISFDELALSISGPSSVRTGGKVVRQKIDISGPGEYAGEKLASQSARISITGPADARVHADKELDVSISGVGSVSYLGNPRITRRISGLGSLQRLR